MFYINIHMIHMFICLYPIRANHARFHVLILPRICVSYFDMELFSSFQPQG